MAEGYAKMRVQSERNIALALTKALREIHGTNMQTIESVKLGAERMINHGSCLIPDDYYRDTCRELINEDRRLVLSLAEIYNRNDVALDMVEIYFRTTLKRLGEQKSITLRDYLIKAVGERAYEYAEKASKLALSLTIAKLIISSGEFQASHMRMVSSLSSMFINGAVVYSKAQMLYFLIEPQMTKIIYQIESGGNNEEIIGDALYELLKK